MSKKNKKVRRSVTAMLNREKQEKLFKKQTNKELLAIKKDQDAIVEEFSKYIHIWKLNFEISKLFKTYSTNHEGFDTDKLDTYIESCKKHIDTIIESMKNIEETNFKKDMLGSFVKMTDFFNIVVEEQQSVSTMMVDLESIFREHADYIKTNYSGDYNLLEKIFGKHIEETNTTDMFDDDITTESEHEIQEIV